MNYQANSTLYTESPKGEAITIAGGATFDGAGISAADLKRFVAIGACSIFEPSAAPDASDLGTGAMSVAPPSNAPKRKTK